MIAFLIAGLAVAYMALVGLRSNRVHAYRFEVLENIFAYARLRVRTNSQEDWHWAYEEFNQVPSDAIIYYRWWEPVSAPFRGTRLEREGLCP